MIERMSAGEYPMHAGAAVILSTSGTTAAPKGVVLGHAGTIRLARACAARQDLAPDQRFYSVGPFFHASGFMHAILTNLVAGSTLFTSRPYTAQEAWDILTQERIHAYHGSIVPLREVCELPQFDRSRLSSLTRAWYSAAATEMMRLERIYGTRMCEVYGLTETAGNVSICRVDDPVDMRHDSDGRPHDGVEAAIVDPETGCVQPEGVPGEIRVRGWNVMLGYFRDPAATAAAIDAEGWLRTGDQGVALPGGYIKFLSRLKDVIRVGGENLSPLEVEEVLMSHPDVQEVAVVSAPHARLTEVPVAFLILRPGRTPDAQALDAFCRERLANFKVPRRFIVLDDFPRSNAVNRVQKAKLRELLGDTPL
jgi:acyl-CoA synthetase (AMP-forming)/AMP-acid ligase II